MAPSITQLLIILGIVIVIFGAKRLRTLGSDMGEAVKGFKEAVKTDDKDDTEKSPEKLANESAENVEQKVESESKQNS